MLPFVILAFIGVLGILAAFGPEIRATFDFRRRRRSWRLSKTVPKRSILSTLCKGLE